MREALLIARREYLERVRSRAFRVSTVLIPLVFVAIFAISILPGTATGTAGPIVVASNNAALAKATRTELLRTKASESDLKHPQDAAEPTEISILAPATERDLETLNRKLESKSIAGYLWLYIRPGQLQPEATYVSRGSADYLGAGRMQAAISHAVIQETLLQHGVNSSQANELVHGIQLDTRQVRGSTSVVSDTGKSFWGAYILAFVLYFAVVFYGMNVAQSVVAEKTSRVFEVLLATAKPESLMAGKLLGVGAAGLTQMAVWILALLLLGAAALGGHIGQGGLAIFGVTPMQLLFFVIYFLLGFFFYSALSAGFGATVSQQSEVQQFSMVLVMPQLVGLVLMVYILANPSAWPVVVLSLLPPFTPIVMCLRIAAMPVPWWQILLSLVLMIASTYGVLWMASRIYRVGILMYGKRPTFSEMLRWLSYS